MVPCIGRVIYATTEHTVDVGVQTLQTYTQRRRNQIANHAAKLHPELRASYHVVIPLKTQFQLTRGKMLASEIRKINVKPSNPIRENISLLI